MKIRIPVLVFLGIAIPALTGALVMAAALSFGVQRGFESYLVARDEARLDAAVLDLSQALASDATAADIKTGGDLLAAAERAGVRFTKGQKRLPPPVNRNRRQPPPPERFPNRLLLFANDGTHLAGPPLPTGTEHARRVIKKPILIGSDQIGFLGVLPRAPVSSATEVQFLDNQYRSAFILLFILILGALVPAWIIARASGRTVSRFAAATNAISSGSYTTKAPESRVTEVAEVSGHIAEMGARLQQLETSRRRWLAEISHELRTPLSAIRAELEALVDGVRPPSGHAIESILKEALHLSRIVDDLHFLAVSDLSGPTCNFEKLRASEFISELALKLRAQAIEHGMELDFCDESGGERVVYWDRDRIEQVLANAIANSIRYSDPGGRIVVTLSPTKDGLNLLVDDTPPGVPPVHLDRLFDPLFRIDESRSRAHGGSGLGLSLLQRIVRAHRGQVTASPSPLGGLRLTIFLPAEGRSR